MVIVWRGLGWLVAVVVFGFSLVANLVFNNLYGEGFYDTHKWPLALSLLGSATVCWFLGRHLKARSARIAIDKATGQEIVINQSQHTLFFIPMHFWGLLLALIALIVFASERMGK